MIMTKELFELKEIIVKSIPIEKLYLFGSFAYGTPQKDSDFDFYAVIPNGSIDPGDAIDDIYLSIGRIKNRPVDILAGTREIFERRSKHNTLERTIAKKGVVLYDNAEW